ncbi:Adhesion G-protein coupled receptor G4 [Channa argus]|uniref:Adhesion G-protein coupled receptor G4 n=1 Tax=Channa argus TaxID=215402 RepID=A0A6G1QTK5_CHAAH|nr:Adhesion G-protein coupled receptor G4 [Channa argus]
MYRHPVNQYVELGMGGKQGHLVVWLFGGEWTTQIVLVPSQWYSLCLTWSHVKDRPALYVNGNLVEMAARDVNTPPSSSCKLAPDGTLTLGATHTLKNGKILVIPFTSMPGKLSLFRLWGRERSTQEVTSLNCSEGDLVNWETDNWDTQICAPLPDPSLKCGFNLNCSSCNTAVCRLLFLQLEKVLPVNMYLHGLSVFEVTRSSEEESLIKPSREDMLGGRAVPGVNRYDCLAYVNVIPSLDVATVQVEINTKLGAPNPEPNDLLHLQVDVYSIYATPVERFSIATTHPSTIKPEVVTKPFPVTTTSRPFTAFPATTFKTTTTPDTSTSVATATTIKTSPADASELFFEVQMNVSLTGDYEPEQILSTWCHNLPHIVSMTLKPLAAKRCETLKCFDSFPGTRTFKVQVMMSPSDTLQMENEIRDPLLKPFTNGSISIRTEDIQISRILILNCNAEIHQTRRGLFEWPTTAGGKNATQPCPKNPQQFATRHCRLCLSTHWMAPDLEACALVVQTIPDLDDVDVTAENALDVVEMIEGLLNNHSTLSYKELVTVLNKLKDIVTLGVVTPNMGQALVNVISDILKSDSHLVPFTNIILNITDTIGNRMVGYEGTFTLVAPAIGISVVDVVPGQFSSLTFGVSSDSTGTNPQSSQKGQTLNTFVVSASVINASSPIKNLDEYVKVMLQHLIPNTDVSRTQVDPANEQILTIITYLGCGVSSLFLGITVLTYTVFEKLRRDYPSQILINLSLALLGLNLVFLVNSWVSSWGLYGLCVTVASMMHYFLLASFTWMGLEAVNMYLALVKVFNVYVPSYILKFCVLGWGLPLVICILVLVVNREAYGNHLYTDFQPSLGSPHNSDSFCWLQDNVTFYVSVVAYAVLVFIFNTAVFVVVLLQIRHMQVNSPAGTRSGLMHDLKGVASLTLLLGLTWTIGFFTWGPARVVLLYLFSGLNTLQGCSFLLVQIVTES